ncbi:MAG: hypothetical protein ACLPVY_27630 [Acidimicrobiia bacterium]
MNEKMRAVLSSCTSARPTAKALGESPSIGHDVRHDQRDWEEQAKDEVLDEFVPLAASDTGGPQSDRQPGDKTKDPEANHMLLSLFGIARRKALGLELLENRCFAPESINVDTGDRATSLRRSLRCFQATSPTCDVVSASHVITRGE